MTDMYSNKNLVFKFPYGWRTIRGIWGNIKYIPRMFKWAFQRMIQGYCDADVWEFDTYLANVIVGGLRQLAETTHSYPFAFPDGDAWKNYLNRIADRVDAATSDDPIDLPCDMHECATEVEHRKMLIKSSFTDLSRFFFDLWD